MLCVHHHITVYVWVYAVCVCLVCVCVNGTQELDTDLKLVYVDKDNRLAREVCASLCVFLVCIITLCMYVCKWDTRT